MTAATIARMFVGLIFLTLVVSRLIGLTLLRRDA